MKRASLLLATCLAIPLGLPQTPQAESSGTDTSRTLDELSEVVVVGSPRLALWKATWRDHVLWILPVVEPLPRSLRWRPQELYDLINKSDEVFTEASLSLHIGDSLAAGDNISMSLRNPDGKRLKDLLPEDLYQLYSGYSSRIGGSIEQLEFLRPSFAALELRKRAMQRMHLDTDGHVHDVIHYFARTNLVPLKSLAAELTVNPRGVASALARVSHKDDIACARAQLDLLQTDLQYSAARAVSWFVGNIAALQEDWERTQLTGSHPSCRKIFDALAPTQRAIRNTRERSFRTLSAALRRNHSTVATVLLDEVFDPEGVVSRLRKAGYKVEAPPRDPGGG